MYTAKIHKFIIIPICAVYDEAGNLVEESKMRPFTHLTTKTINLSLEAVKLERLANEKFFSKLDTPGAKPEGPTGD